MLSIWPPSQRTRDAVIYRLMDTLSPGSVVSKRYGAISAAEVEDAARLIEKEAFDTIHGSSDSTSPGVEILQQYTNEITRQLLEYVGPPSR
ncbi:unnamed protein product [Linum tenue]|nr:unnamed protein product [Linum tenue]